MEHFANELQLDDHRNKRDFVPAAFCLRGPSPLFCCRKKSLLPLVDCVYTFGEPSPALPHSLSLSLRQGKIKHRAAMLRLQKGQQGLQTKRHRRQTEREGASGGVQSQAIRPFSFVYARFVAITAPNPGDF